MERTTPEVTGRPLAVFAGTVAAGPAFTAMVLSAPDSLVDVLVWPIAWAGLSFMFAMFAVAMAVVPVGIGVLLGGWLGARWRWGRHPLLWAAVGGGSGALLIPEAAHTMLPVVPAGAGLPTGLVIALVARRFIAWID